jgi:hypothetical protein
MDELLRVIEQYKIFNYLVPGVIVTFLIGDGTFYHKLQSQNILVEFFIYYFVGLIVSRLGSLFVEGFLRNIGMVKFAPYSDYLDASKKDEKIEKFSQENNMYRTFIAAFLTIFLVNLGYRIFSDTEVLVRETVPFLLGMLTLAGLMTLSYRKQTAFIGKRIDHQGKRK